MLSPRSPITSLTLLAVTAAVLSNHGSAQDLEARVESLEQENQDLKLRIDSLAGEVERVQLGDLIPSVGESEWGMGPAASKVYATEQGLSIGGYGEFLYQSISGESDKFDTQRVVTYFGYKFDEQWLFNSEIEVEHGTTSDSSGTTDSDGEVAVEFAYLDYLHSQALNFRGGLVLTPIGLVNELHEPTTYLAANRAQTEKRIIPTTWRQNGVGVFGDAGGFAYRAYVVNGLDGERFDASGLRDGRQKGNRAAIDDVAVVARVDYVDTPGLIVGGSAYYGDSGQGKDDIPDLGTTIVEVHTDFRHGPWILRALGAMADVDDAREFNLETGENLGDEMLGYYVEAGYDLLAGHPKQSLTAFARWEDIDTNESVPSGFSADSDQHDKIVTFGLNYKPIEQVVLKLDYEDWDDSGDRLNFLIGYVF